MIITFNSASNVIAIVQVAVQLIEALNASQRSSKKYREVVQELEALRAALEQVYLYPSYTFPFVSNLCMR